MIEDNGVGFEPQYEDPIFEVLERLRKKSEVPGTGVGLATVKKAITLQSGRVWAEGRSGKGATFYLALPFGETDA